MTSMANGGDCTKASRLRRLQVRGGSAIGAIGALVIAIAVVKAAHPAQVAVGAPIGAALMAMLVWLGYTNRRSKAKTRRGLPAWSAGIGLFAASITVAAAIHGYGGAPILSSVGGLLMTYGVGLVFVPRLLLADRY